MSDRDKKFFNVNLEYPEYRVIRRSVVDADDTCDCLYDSLDAGDNYFDYVRYRILGLCSQAIKNNSIPGNIAELGVFQGTFCKKINQLFPDRNLYLYDTFEGFSEKDIMLEEQPENIKKESWYSWIMSDKRDLVQVIKSILPYPDKAIFRKGYFPDTTQADHDLRFAFVSLDVDIYKPTLEGLKFFYPRLSPGGYIFIHDSQFPGVLRAIQQYNRDVDLAFVPICDFSSSTIIVKPLQSCLKFEHY